MLVIESTSAKSQDIGASLLRVVRGFLLVAATSLGLLSPSIVNANGFSLNGTIYDDVAKEVGVDPYMLYAVTLVESGKAVGGQVQPWPYVLRAIDARIYAADEFEFRAAFELFQTRYGDRFDVGLGQTNVYWQVTRAGRVKDPAELLDIRTNLVVTAKVLKDAMRSAPKDPELGVGRYHNWKDEDRARLFGKRVLAVHQNLIAGP